MIKKRRISDEVAHAIVNLWKQPGVNLRDAVALVVEVNGKQVAVRWDALAADLLDLDATIAKTQHKLDVQRATVEKAHRAFHEAPGMSGYHHPDDDVGDMMAKAVGALATARAAAQTLIAEVRRNHPAYEVPGRIVEFSEALDDTLGSPPSPAPAQPPIAETRAGVALGAGEAHEYRPDDVQLKRAERDAATECDHCWHSASDRAADNHGAQCCRCHALSVPTTSPVNPEAR